MYENHILHETLAAELKPGSLDPEMSAAMLSLNLSKLNPPKLANKKPLNSKPSNPKLPSQASGASASSAPVGSLVRFGAPPRYLRPMTGEPGSRRAWQMADYTALKAEQALRIRRGRAQRVRLGALESTGAHMRFSRRILQIYSPVLQVTNLNMHFVERGFVGLPYSAHRNALHCVSTEPREAIPAAPEPILPQCGPRPQALRLLQALGFRV